MAISKSAGKRSVAGYVAAHLSQIEHAISVGIYHQAICEEIGQAGYAVSLSGFRRALARARQHARGQRQDVGIPPQRVDMLKIAVPGRKLSADELNALASLKPQA